MNSTPDMFQILARFPSKSGRHSATSVLEALLSTSTADRRNDKSFQTALERAGNSANDFKSSQLLKCLR